MRQAEADEPDVGEEEQFDRGGDRLGRDLRRRAGRRPPAVQHDDVDPAERSDGRRDQAVEVDGPGQVAGDGQGADPCRLALDDVRAAREHRHVRTLRDEPLGDRETHAL